jgi:hypothetical protein
MTRALWSAPLVAAAFVLAGCDGDDGRDGMDGADGADGLNSLIATVTLPKGDADCPGGGRVIQSGLDSNRNGILDPSEVTSTEFLECATAPRLRALHASPDAPAVNILVNGAVALTDVDYTDGSGFVPVSDVTRVQVEAILPGTDAIVIDETLDLEFSRDYTVIAAGRVAAPIGAFVVSNPTDAPIAPGNFRAQVAHAAPNAPAVDVFVTAPGADLAGATPINSSGLAYRGATEQVEAPAGDYQIRVTAAGNPAAVVFDSGTVALPAGADLLAVAVENTGPGDTPIQVVVLDGTAAADLLDVNTPASVVAVHASPDAPAVDVLADIRSTATVEAIALAQGLPFPQFCEIPAVPAPGGYTLSITAAGDPSTVALQFDLDVEKGNELTAIVTGYLASGTPAIQPLPLVNDRRSVVTEAKLRVTHGSPATGAVDLYLVADGTDLNDPGTTPAFAAVPFGADTGILSIAPGTYDVYVTPAGDKGVVAIEVQDLALSGGEVLDVIARDPEIGGGEGPLPQLIVIDYAALTACPNPPAT